MRHVHTALIALLTLGPTGAQEVLPVSRVTLFTNGVAYIEHSGNVQGDVTLRLTVTTAQVNDLLKSLVLMDEAGSVDTVRYPSQEPLDRLLAGFSIDLRGVTDLLGLLDRLKGAELTVTTSAPVTGRLVGVENRPTAREGVVVSEGWLNLWTPTGLQSLPLRAVTAIQPNDPLLREEFQKALQILDRARNDEKKTLEISLRGRGRRTVRLGYVVESPVWKTAYRLDLGTGRAFLQAWAVVENVTEQDWTNVSLSLVSGRPNSFVQDLYTPIFSPRPVVPPPVTRNVAPTTPRPGIPDQARSRPSAEGFTSAPPAPALQRLAEPPPARLEDSGVLAQAQGEAVGELYRFTVETPIHLPRRQSALIPVFTGDIQAEKVAYAIAGAAGSPATGPFTAAWVTNSTAVDFPGGAVTVLDGGLYAGDALLDSLPRRQRRLLVFGQDTRLRIQSEEEQTTAATALRIVRGVLHLQSRLTVTRTYRLANSAERERVLILDHPLQPNGVLKQPERHEERTPTHYRFRISVPVTEAHVFRVVEEVPLQETVALLPLSPAQLVSYTTRQQIAPRVREALQRAADLKTRVETLAQEVRDLERQRSQTEAAQQRTRDNLAAVGRETAQGRRFLDQLMQQEEMLQQLGRQIEEKAQAQRAAQRELEQYLSGLTLD